MLHVILVGSSVDFTVSNFLFNCKACARLRTHMRYVILIANTVDFTVGDFYVNLEGLNRITNTYETRNLDSKLFKYYSQ